MIAIALLLAAQELPVREITVFKDGHALVLHEGSMPVDASGNVLLDTLPAPVIGTFWPFASDPTVKLASVVAGSRTIRTELPATNLRDLLLANPGAEVLIRETHGAQYWAKIEDVPGGGNAVMLKTPEGRRLVMIDRLADVTFKDPMKAALAREERRNALTLRLDWGGARPAAAAQVGMMYLQKGIRWIPGYRIELDGKGKAIVKLQATLLNELTDLADVTAHLVIGVPAFAFKDTIDPIALQQGVAQLSSYFHAPSQTAYAFGNAMMTQMSRMSEHSAPAPAGNPAPLGDKKEDLFVFTVKGISLRKGECMVLPVTEFTLDYRDVYTLDLPIAPPQEMWRQHQGQQQAELARLFNAPKAIHKMRLSNASRTPITTAPAMIMSGGRVLGQGMTTYTPPGGRCDVEITTAVDIQVRKSEVESDRTPNALRWRGDAYERIEMKGTIGLSNLRGDAVEIEVTRHVLGEADAPGAGGRAERVNILEDGTYLRADATPSWWHSYSWPWYWHHLNPVTRFTWTVKLEPGKSVELPYAWRYYWR